MADYSIKIMNETGNIQTYSLFQEAPKVSRYRYQSSGAQSRLLSQEAPKAQGIPVNQVFTNIYQAAPPIQNNGTALFKMHKTFSAVCGTSPAPLAIGHTVTGSAAESVNLTEGDVPGSKVFLTAPYNNPQWDDSETWTTSSPNAFAIVTDTNFEYPNESKRLLFQA